MTMYVERGLGGLAAYAQDVLNDSDKAQRVWDKLQEVKEFLASEGLAVVSNPRAEIERARGERSRERYTKLQNHLAAVAQEALHVEDGQFVHQTRMGVARRLRERMSEGDPRLIPHYTDATLAHHVFDAGVAVVLGGVFQKDRERLRSPLTLTVASLDFSDIVPENGWRETLVHASRILPEGADGFDLSSMLMHFQHVGNIRGVTERFEMIRESRRPHNAA